MIGLSRDNYKKFEVQAQILARESLIKLSNNYKNF